MFTKPVSGLLVASLAVALLPIGTAEARRVAVDFGGSFPSQGSDWQFPSTFYAPSDLPTTGTLGFTYQGFSGTDLNIGGATFTGFCMFEDGAFSLTQSGGGCSDSGSALFNLAAGLDLVGSDTADNPFATGAMFVSHGYSADYLIDAEPGEADPYALEDAVTSLRFTWYDMANAATPDTPQYQLQAYIYFLGGGDFGLDLRYGGGPFTGATQSISFNGESLYSSESPPVELNNYFFCFSGGALADCPSGEDPPPTGVPEPATGALLLAGLLGLAVLQRRKLRGII
jgi:MYXO-CTERM domain-containing protein